MKKALNIDLPAEELKVIKSIYIRELTLSNDSL